MAEEGKKISFGFSKSIKKPVLQNLPKPEVKKVDFIECLDGKSIKVIGGEEKESGPLVIPMLGSKTWHDRILNKVDADIFEPKDKTTEIPIKTEPNDSPIIPNGQSDVDVSSIKKEPTDEQPKENLTLEQQAAQEILQDIGQELVKEEKKDLTLPLTDNDNLKGHDESTLEDYEQIPIESYGLAMLRGMGWQPGKGIGKNEQLVQPKLPELRPRGMGLGADTAIKKMKTSTEKNGTKKEEEVKLMVGGFVKINQGKYQGKYGQLEDFDKDIGRMSIKLALRSEPVSVNEFLVEAVSKEEYNKNSKVLNASKYEEFKGRDNSESQKPESKSKTSSRSRKRKSDTSDDERPSRRRRSSSSDSGSSSGDCRDYRDYKDNRRRKSKKKNKRRDSSSSSSDDFYERRSTKSKKSNKKSKKKEKTRDRSRDRRTEYSESLDRRKKDRKQRRRSRS